MRKKLVVLWMTGLIILAGCSHASTEVTKEKEETQENTATQVDEKAQDKEEVQESTGNMEGGNGNTGKDASGEAVTL